jgi:hypothetical protein
MFRLMRVIAAGSLLFSASAFARTLIAPQILETKAPMDKKADFNYDTSLVLINASGLGGIQRPGDGSADVKLFLYDDSTGSELTGANGSLICAGGCAFHLEAGKKVSRSIEQLANDNAGGLKAGQLTAAYAVVTITGPGAEATSMLFFIQNNHAGAFDTSVLSYSPEEVLASP